LHISFVYINFATYFGFNIEFFLIKILKYE
jgi:hypothetical protein